MNRRFGSMGKKYIYLKFRKTENLVFALMFLGFTLTFAHLLYKLRCSNYFASWWVTLSFLMIFSGFTALFIYFYLIDYDEYKIKVEKCE